jgi:hypothetical protein
LLLAAERARSEPDSEDFALGYASAVLERELEASEAELMLVDGVLWVRSDALGEVEREKLARALQPVAGIREVRLSGGDPAVSAAPPSGRPVEVSELSTETATLGWHLFPETELFDPLLADPRWPHFAAAYQNLPGDDELSQAAAVSFGETIPLAGGPAPLEGRADLSLHAGVFSIFDLDSDSFDLVNSDFLVGLASSYRRRDFALMLRLAHQSSHLGDEYLLRDRVERINLSFEELDLILSQDLPGGFRVYGGGSYLVHADPSDLDPWGLQLGLEARSPEAWLDGNLRPIAALDLQSREETDWDLDLSLRVGLQLERRRLFGQALQIFLEYYDGHSPNGQFFVREIRSVGLGAHVHF